jgi:hypothetical protein
MADTPTTRGAYRKQGLGDRSAAWGLASGLNGVFDSLDEAVHGFNGVALATVNYTLTSTNYTTNEVRQRFHRFTNGGISANATITVPATENWWIVSNAVTGFSLTVSNGSNSVVLSDGATSVVATDGTDIYEFELVSSLVAPDPGSNGVVVRTALGATVARTLTGPAAGITVTAGDGVSANPTLALANDLAAVEGLASNGIAVRTATDTWAVRTLTAGGGITITHGDGISASPTVAVDINGSASAVGGVATDDEVLIYDTSATAIRKAPVSDFISLSGGMADPGANGIVVRTSSGVTTARTITGTTNEITVTHGNGVSANPTISLPASLVLGAVSATSLTVGGASATTENELLYAVARAAAMA